jgi:hypothetical protein
VGTASSSAELEARQDALQHEARELIAELDLDRVLGDAGRACPIGSFVSGLMVWRDLDFTVVSGRTELVPDALARLLADPRTRELHYRDERGGEDPRLYVVLRYEAPGGAVWKVDLSFWTSDAPRAEIGHPEALRARLTGETRLAILSLKDLWHRDERYPYRVGSMDIYDAVLNHDVRTADEFDEYLRERAAG